MTRTFLDDRLDIGFGIDWRSWGIGGNITIHGDINSYYEHFGPLYFSVILWGKWKDTCNDI